MMLTCSREVALCYIILSSRERGMCDYPKIPAQEPLTRDVQLKPFNTIGFNFGLCHQGRISRVAGSRAYIIVNGMRCWWRKSLRLNNPCKVEAETDFFKGHRLHVEIPWRKEFLFEEREILTFLAIYPWLRSCFRRKLIFPATDAGSLTQSPQGDGLSEDVCVVAQGGYWHMITLKSISLGHKHVIPYMPYKFEYYGVNTFRNTLEPQSLPTHPPIPHHTTGLSLTDWDLDPITM